MNDPSAADFERDRGALDAALEQIEGWDGDAVQGGDPEAKLAATELMVQFYTKNCKRLEADGNPVSGVLRDFALQRRFIEKARRKGEDRVRGMLHVGANLAAKIRPRN